MPCKLAISSMSLGRCYAGHSLDHRLLMAKKYGYKGVEIAYEDIVHLAAQDPSSSPSSLDLLVVAARRVRDMCEAHQLEVICLQPFMHFEGLVDRAAHQARLAELEIWLSLARALETDLIAIPSNFLPASETSGDLDLIVSDLREAADLAISSASASASASHANPPIRLSYESLAWGTHVDTWERCWEVVQRVDRPNFGMCLDSFNIAARVYADPSSPTGTVPDADAALRQSLERLVATVDVRKVFYVQIVDAERLAEPLVGEAEGRHALHVPGCPPRMSWSRNCRLFYGEADRRAYLPIADIASAIFHGLRYEGWVSLELFNRRMAEEDADVPEELARRGAVSWTKLVRDMNLDGQRPVSPCYTSRG